MDQFQTHNPKLVVTGKGNQTDRRAMHLFLRPALMLRMSNTAKGSKNLVIELAIQKFLDDLDAQPDGSVKVVAASELDPNTDDFAAAEYMNANKRKW